MKQSAALWGGVLIAAGVAGGGYAYWRYRQGQASAASVGGLTVTVTPNPLANSQQLATAVFSWTNGTSAQQTYTVQAAWLEELSGGNGVIAGHLFNSSANASASLSNQSLVTSPAARLTTATAAAGGAASATLYGEIDPSLIVGPIGVVAWVVPGAGTSVLLASDPVGMQALQTTATGRRISTPLAVA